jgi:hypothetical protein
MVISCKETDIASHVDLMGVTGEHVMHCARGDNHQNIVELSSQGENQDRNTNEPDIDYLIITVNQELS